MYSTEFFVARFQELDTDALVEKLATQELTDEARQALIAGAAGVSAWHRTVATCLVAAASCTPLTAWATNYTGVLTTAIGIPLLYIAAGLLLTLLVVRTQPRSWLSWLATILAAALLLAGVWVFEIDTWRLWPYANDSQRVTKGITVGVYCVLWLAVLVQTCLLWILRPRRPHAH